MTELVPPPSTSRKSLMERVEDALLPLINLVFLLLMFCPIYRLRLRAPRNNRPTPIC